MTTSSPWHIVQAVLAHFVDDPVNGQFELVVPLKRGRRCPHKTAPAVCQAKSVWSPRGSIVADGAAETGRTGAQSQQQAAGGTHWKNQSFHNRNQRRASACGLQPIMRE